jgi:hypothetical protein
MITIVIGPISGQLSVTFRLFVSCGDENPAIVGFRSPFGMVNLSCPWQTG